MDKSQLIIALIGSAAVGALVSSIVSLTAQYFERKSRRQEFLLKEALDLAQWRNDMDAKLAYESKQNIELHDKIVLAEKYYQWLLHMWKHDGKLPEDPKIER